MKNHLKTLSLAIALAFAMFLLGSPQIAATQTYNSNNATQGTAASLTGLAISASIGGGALAAGACSSGTVTITGAAIGMVVAVTPRTYPGDGTDWKAYVSSTNTVTIDVCAMVAKTPTASIYDVRVVQ